MHIDSEDLHRIVEDIWSSMLGLAVRGSTRSELPEDGRTLSATVQITGSWQGAVSVACPEGTARSFAAVMFGLEDGEAGDADVHDAIGELTNMTGGNVKSLVEGPASLSLPTVTEGRQLRVTVPGSQLLHHTLFEAEELPFSVTVVSRDDS
jgi:chemotaxis protein CheX